MTAVAYLIGYLIHFFSLLFWKIGPPKDHRQMFAEELNDKNKMIDETIEKLFDICEEDLGEDYCCSNIEKLTALYPYVLSKNHLSGNSQSIYLQAIYSFFRSITTSIALVIIFNIIYLVLILFDIYGAKESLFGSITSDFWSLYILYVIVLIAVLLLSYAAQIYYAKYYVQYLISDFVSSYNI